MARAWLSRSFTQWQVMNVSSIGYVVHGAGCRMTDENGRMVDVDMERDAATGQAGWRRGNSAGHRFRCPLQAVGTGSD